MARVIAIANEKGGVGKTTTTHTLGNAFVTMGKRVLLVDADPQGNLTTACGFDGDELGEREITLAHVLADNVAIKDAIVSDNPALVASNHFLQRLNDVLVKEEDPPIRLRAHLRMVLDDYDYILIDCGPGITMSTLNAFGAADQILIPTCLDDYSLRGIQRLYTTISRFAEVHNPRLRVIGILPTKFAKHYQSEREHLSDLTHHFGMKTKIFEPIPLTGWVNNHVSKIKSIVSARPHSAGAKNYMQLARDIEHLRQHTPGTDVDVGRPTPSVETA